MTLRGTLALLALVALIATGGWWWMRHTRERGDVGAEIATRLGLKARPQGIHQERIESELHRFYAQRKNAPAWSDGRAPNAGAYELIEVFQKAGREGLDSTVFAPARLARELSELRPRSWWSKPISADSLARFDVAMSRAALRFLFEQHDGRFPPAVLDPDWLALRDTIDAVVALNRAAGSQRVEHSFSQVIPRSKAYRALREALERYQKIADAGGWREIPAGPVLKRDAEDERVPALRQRLAAESLLEGDAGGGVFDDKVETALKSFQARVGLPAKGLVDDATRAALNVPVQRRLEQVAINMERRRWIPPAFAEPYIQVNVPAFHLDVHDSNRVALEMRVVVGARRNPTPVFSDTITYLEMNPFWRLPKRIVVEEMLPGLKKDPEHLSKQKIRVLYTGGKKLEEVRADSIDWSDVEGDSFPFVVRQDSGVDNPLGRVKFMFPNEYDVYLHDTPTRYLFASEARAQSHGCVRVQKPLALAERLLNGQPQGLKDSLDAIFESGALRRVMLDHPIPVYLLYWTAWVDDAGVLQFRNDLYGLDERMATDIAKGRTSQFVLNPDLIWGSKKAEAAAAAKRGNDRAAAPASRSSSGASARR